MNINEADQTSSLISRINSDNLAWFSLFGFLQQRTFIFRNSYLPLHMIFKCMAKIDIVTLIRIIQRYFFLFLTGNMPCDLSLELSQETVLLVCHKKCSVDKYG